MKAYLKFAEGAWFTDTLAEEAVMGYEAAELEQREVGDLILIPGHKDKIKIVGVLQRTGTQDDGTIFLPLGLVQKMFKKEGLLTGVGVRIKKGLDSQKLEDRLYNLPDVQVVSMAQVKDTIISLVGTARVMVFSIAVIAILIAMLGVINTIIMSVFERFKEIGILKSMGAMPGDIFKLILLETLFLCLAGGLLGIGMAFALEKATDLAIRNILPYAPTGSMIQVSPLLALSGLGMILVVGLVRDSTRPGGPRHPAHRGHSDRRQPMSAEIVIRAEDIVKNYHRGSEEVRAVEHVSVEIKKGEFVSFVGPSGSGKTTLVNILDVLTTPLRERSR